MKKFIGLFFILSLSLSALRGQSDFARLLKYDISTARQLLEKGENEKAAGLVRTDNELTEKVYAAYTVRKFDEYLLAKYLCHYITVKAGDTETAGRYFEIIQSKYSHNFSRDKGPLGPLIFVNLLMNQAIYGKLPAEIRLAHLVSGKQHLLKVKEDAFGAAGIEQSYLRELCDFDFSRAGISETLDRIDSYIGQYSPQELIQAGYLLGADISTKMIAVRAAIFKEAARRGIPGAAIVADNLFKGKEKIPALSDKNKSPAQSEAEKTCRKAVSLFFIDSGLPDYNNIAQMLLPLEPDDGFIQSGGAYCMAALYEHGAGVPQNTEKAFELYLATVLRAEQEELREAAYERYRRLTIEKSHREVMDNLGNKPLTSFQIPELRQFAFQFAFLDDTERELECLTELAARRNGKICNDLAIRYMTGTNAPINQELAVKLLKRGAETGYPPAIYNYAISLFCGRGTFPDLEKAVEVSNLYLKTISNPGAPDFDAGELMKSQRYILSFHAQEKKKGTELHREADYFRSSEGLIEYARQLQKFSNEPAAKILYYLERARKFGNKKAGTEIGRLYYLGFAELPPDYAKAREYFEEAVPDKWAQWYLGVVYEYGKGVDKDLNKALEYYQSAAAAGITEAVEKIKTVKNSLHAPARPK